ncbi:hypothetical protein RB195_025777 [Necator americanus]|uniref:Reverse transcriptase domain-containing protein n=1 Tax=Necator americanus TaxID=51031 RepID=A0ABR1ETT8_NECAM
MGQRLAPVLAVCFMSRIEQPVIERLPQMYCRYIDDCFIITSTQSEIDECFRILNERSQYIKLTREQPKDDPQVADRELIADQKRPCACPETRVDSGNGLPVSAEPGLTHDILVSRTSVRPKARNRVTGRCKGGGLESPPTNKLHMSTQGERKFFQKLMGL